MGLLDRIDLSRSLLWDRYEVINQQKCMVHHFCATGDSKIHEQKISLWSLRKCLALEEKSSLRIYCGVLSWGWHGVRKSLQATETVPSAWGEGGCSSYRMGTYFVNTQVPN